MRTTFSGSTKIACALLRVASSELASFSSASASRREATAPGPGSVKREAPEAVAAPASAGVAPEGEQRLGAPAAKATPRGSDAAAALAARQAALATDQAALAAKQAALAAEQAALAGERAALAAEPAASLTSLESEHDAGLVAEDDGERTR